MTSHNKSWNIKMTTTCDIGNADPALGHIYICGGNKPNNGISILPF